MPDAAEALLRRLHRLATSLGSPEERRRLASALLRALRRRREQAGDAPLDVPTLTAELRADVGPTGGSLLAKALVALTLQAAAVAELRANEDPRLQELARALRHDTGSWQELPQWRRLALVQALAAVALRLLGGAPPLTAGALEATERVLR